MAAVSEGHYVVAEGAGRRMLLLGPFPALGDAEGWVERARWAHRRAQPTAYAYTYLARAVQARPGERLPPGRLNERLGLRLAVPEVAPPVRGELNTDAVRRVFTPYNGAEFRHARLAGEGAGAVVCRITAHTPTTVWFRPIRADGGLGELHRCTTGDLRRVVKEWTRHPFAAPERWGRRRSRA